MSERPSVRIERHVVRLRGPVGGAPIAAAAVAGLGACVLGPWQLGRMAQRERPHAVWRDACGATWPVAVSTRDTGLEMAASARGRERIHRDAGDERRAEEGRRSAEGWKLIAAKARAGLSAIAHRCGEDRG